jgi:hypothetical protein
MGSGKVATAEIPPHNIASAQKCTLRMESVRSPSRDESLLLAASFSRAECSESKILGRGQMDKASFAWVFSARE